MWKVSWSTAVRQKVCSYYQFICFGAVSQLRWTVHRQCLHDDGPGFQGCLWEKCDYSHAQWMDGNWLLAILPARSNRYECAVIAGYSPFSHRKDGRIQRADS